MDKAFGGALFTEKMLQNIYRGYNQKGLPPTLTEIRNFVPKAQFIGDFDFQITSDQLHNLFEWKRLHPTTDI